MVSAVDVEEWSFLKIVSVKRNNKTWISQTVSTKLLSPGETDGATRSREQADVQTGGRAVHRSRCVIFQFLIFLLDSVDEERIHLALFQKYLFPPKEFKMAVDNGHYLSTNKPLLSNQTTSEIEDKLET